MIELLSWEMRELARSTRLRKQMREQDERKHRDPDFDPTLPRVWVLYQWQEPTKRRLYGRWLVAGFARTPRLKLPRLKKIRRHLRVPDDALVLLVDLFHAQRVGPPTAPPSQYNPMIERPWLAPQLRERR